MDVDNLKSNKSYKSVSAATHCLHKIYKKGHTYVLHGSEEDKPVAIAGQFADLVHQPVMVQLTALSETHTAEAWSVARGHRLQHSTPRA